MNNQIYGVRAFAYTGVITGASTLATQITLGPRLFATTEVPDLASAVAAAIIAVWPIAWITVYVTGPMVAAAILASPVSTQRTKHRRTEAFLQSVHFQQPQFDRKRSR